MVVTFFIILFTTSYSDTTDNNDCNIKYCQEIYVQFENIVNSKVGLEKYTGIQVWLKRWPEPINGMNDLMDAKNKIELNNEDIRANCFVEKDGIISLRLVFFITEKGDVQCIQAIRSGCDYATSVASDFIKGIKFNPGVLAGDEPVLVQFTLPFVFKFP